MFQGGVCDARGAAEEDSEGEARGGDTGDASWFVVEACGLAPDPCVVVVDTVVERAKVFVRVPPPLEGVLVGEAGTVLLVVAPVG